MGQPRRLCHSSPHMGVCLTESGDTLAENGLKIISVLMESWTVLVARPDLPPNKQAMVDYLRRLLLGVLEARDYVKLEMNVPIGCKEEVTKRLPALKKPTVAAVGDGEEYIAIGAVVPRKQVNDIIYAVLEAGAEDVVEVALTRMVRHR